MSPPRARAARGIVRLLALLVLLGGPVRAGTDASSAGSPLPRAERLAEHFQRPLADVAELRRQGLGYGEIVKVLVIARESRRPLDELLRRHGEGYGWGTLCRQLGLDTVAILKKVETERLDLGIRVRRDRVQAEERRD